MIDTEYDEDNIFVRHVYFAGGQDPYTTLRTSLKSTTSRPFPITSTGEIAVKAINFYGDEVLVARGVGR